MEKSQAFEELGWTLGALKGNYGDLLLRDIQGQFLDFEGIQRKYAGGVFGGSLLTQKFLDETVSKHSVKPYIFYGVGIQDMESASVRIPREVDVLGVRGPYSAMKSGLTAIGDPGILTGIALDIQPTISETRNKIFIPHHIDPTKYQHSQMQRLETFGVNARYFRKLLGIQEREGKFKESHLVHIIDKFDSVRNKTIQIANADFVLTSSLHAGIVAFALGTPFCFFKDTYTNYPIKFRDFSEHHNLPISFEPSIEEGIDFFLRNRLNWGVFGEENIKKLMEPLLPYISRTGFVKLGKAEHFLRLRTQAFEAKCSVLMKKN